jgi:membrane-bound serine protease (ClpP class)
MSLPERLLHVITDPNIAYLLLMIGFVGILAELSHPGWILPGLTGAIALVLAFMALGSLPVNWAGVLLLVLGVGLFIADLLTGGIGVLAGGALLAFVLGSLILYSPFGAPSPVLPDVHVNRWLIAAVAVGLASLLLVIGRALLRARRRPIAMGGPALVGRVGTVESLLSPRGTVRIDSEVWSATLVDDEPAIAPGEPIEVVGLEGVMLRVRRAGKTKAGSGKEV